MSDFYKNWKKDIVEDAQEVMNANKSMANKNLISSMTNEIIALRAEVERLEAKCLSQATGVKQLVVRFDAEGKIDFVEASKYG